MCIFPLTMFQWADISRPLSTKARAISGKSCHWINDIILKLLFCAELFIINYVNVLYRRRLKRWCCSPHLNNNCQLMKRLSTNQCDKGETNKRINRNETARITAIENIKFYQEVLLMNKNIYKFWALRNEEKYLG